MKSLRTTLARIGAGIVLTGLSLAANVAGASAQPWYNGPPPPPARFERHPPRAGFVWESGHWERFAGRWVWRPGHYVAVNGARHWVPGHWVVGPRGRYWIGGHWA
jgi:hypothetical protein